jgi:hypothetical protein
MKIKDKELDQILNEVSGIFDFVYEESETDANGEYVCEVEDRLFNYLKKKGLIEEE